jgi:hypothetical protein
VIDFTIAYVLGLATFSLFLVTRKFLRTRQGNESSKTERCLYSLSVISLFWMVLIAPLIFAMELLFVFITPVQSWSHTVELFNEYSNPFSSFKITFAAITVGCFVIGYFDNQRGMYGTVNAVCNQWLCVLLVLYVVVGLVGVFTGLLI